MQSVMLTNTMKPIPMVARSNTTIKLVFISVIAIAAKELNTVME